MKISLNWLKDYIELKDSPEAIGKLLTDTGLEVEGIEVFETVKGGLEGIVVGEVLTCEKHPNADKLKVTTVDIGIGTVSPIVCGAPNVAKGQKVIVATVNSTLYPVEGDSFKIKKAKIRGEVSEGMICAEDEIGLGASHDGIIVLDTDVPNGTPASSYYQLENDSVFEIGLTPNRADAMGHIGTARDLKAVLGHDLVWPQVGNYKPDNNELTINVSVENFDACPRYSGVTLTNISVQESPDWLKNRLKAIGLAPINNVVDITNYVLHETGQPMHAFDAAKITGNNVIVKTANEGDKFVTLDEKERTLKSKDLMICDGNGKGMCIAGVFGGIDSGVTESTKSIFLESAYFSAAYVRKTAQVHQLKTDASFRFERGTDPEITIYALKRAALLLKELAGATISSEIIDVYPTAVEPITVAITYHNIKRLIGIEIEKDRIHSILESLDISVTNKTDLGFDAEVPAYRVDVQREVDVIEEILRIYGFNNIKIPATIGANYLADFPKVDRDKLQGKVTDSLVAQGFYEVMTNSLTKPLYSQSDDSINEKEDVVILNKLSEDLGVLRQTLLYSLAEVANHNINRKQSDLKIFEFGKTYKKAGDKYVESNRLAIALTGNLNSEHWSGSTNPVQFHDVYGVVSALISQFTSKRFTSEVKHDNPYQYSLQLIINSKVLATIGKVKSANLKSTGVKQELFFADIDWDLLLKQANDTIVYEEVSKFPEVRRDLSLVIDKSVSFDQVKSLAQEKERKLLRAINAFDVYEGDKIDENKKAYALSFILQDTEKTLTDKVIDKTMNKLMASFESDLGAVIRK